MNYFDIETYIPINRTKKEKVNSLVESILANGYQGAPMLTWGNTLVTGSHRLAALHQIESMLDAAADDADWDEYERLSRILENDKIALDVTEIIEESEEELQYDDLERVFAGTEIEKWKSEIEEW